MNKFEGVDVGYIPNLFHALVGRNVVICDDSDARSIFKYRGVIEGDYGKWFNVRVKGKSGSYTKSFSKFDILTGNLTVKIV